jgi:hypothetical protein
MAGGILTVTEEVVLVVPESTADLLETAAEPLIIQTSDAPLEILELPASHELLEMPASHELLEVAKQGLPGPQGIPGPTGGAALQRTAGETLSALRAVYELGGAVYALGQADVDHIDALLGITLTAADEGQLLNVQRSGVMDDAGWNWTPGRVYLGAAGALTQTPAADGFDVLIGTATAPTRLMLNLQDPISLE